MYCIAICDDILQDNTQLATYISHWNPQCKISAFTSGEALLTAIEQGSTFVKFIINIFVLSEKSYFRHWSFVWYCG